ncbi:hypothetical protein SUGI_0945250 [Cryptomeria japonica]|nr:hypothetical protein SUGI_0945250 [Cryptomeria japonica]
MKTEAAVFVKQVWTVISEMLKKKSHAVKNKAIFSTLSRKVHSVFRSEGGLDLVRSKKEGLIAIHCQHVPKDLDMEIARLSAAISDCKENPKVSSTTMKADESNVVGGEIDNVADEFIKSFRRQMQLQQQDSFKMYEAMLARSV